MKANSAIVIIRPWYIRIIPPMGLSVSGCRKHGIGITAIFGKKIEDIIIFVPVKRVEG
jgi:hypothetical protein